MTILQFLDVTTPYLAKNQVESSRLTAELMLAEVLQKKRMQLYLEFESQVPESALERLRPLVKRRAGGEPLQYIQGFAEFRGARFKVTPEVLIPRPETEMLVESVIPLITAEPGLMIDVGTGSGIIGITLARQFPSHRVLALDKSPAALEIARHNGKELNNITFQESDLLSAWSEPHAQLIVANLPYIPTGQIATLSREVRKEPLLAQDGGTDGLQFIRRLIEESRSRTDYLALEFGDHQAPAIKTLLQEGGFEVTQTMQDLRQLDRIIIGAARG